jgi:hypothetical protein
MLLSADVMRLFLVLCLLGMSLLAIFYLRRRELSFEAYLGWGTLAIVVPILGPFLVILSRPGKPIKTVHTPRNIHPFKQDHPQPNLSNQSRG